MYIYKTLCLVNGKIYIGQSCKESSKSKKYIGGGTILAVAIKKYGKENFTKEVLKDDISTRKMLNIWEKLFIKKFNSCNPDVGYNIIQGAAIGHNCVNPSTIPSIALRISQTLKDKGIQPSRSENIQAKITASLIGNNRRLGISHTEQSRLSISKANKGKPHNMPAHFNEYMVNKNKNLIWTEEMKDRIRQSNKRRKINNKLRKNGIQCVSN